MAAGIKQVAQEAGVSIGTVSNVLNHPEAVAPATRDRVLAAIEKLGWVRNGPASQLRAGRGRTIALIVLDVANPFFTDVARGADLVAESSGALVIVCNSGEDAAREHRHLDMLEEHRVLGVLITPVEGVDNARLTRFAARGTPVVLVDRTSALSDRCSVAVDDIAGGRLVGTHLRELGHRRVAFVGGPATVQQVADRYAGFAETIGPDAVITVVATAGLTVAGGRRAAAGIAELDPESRATAVFCANDLVALGVLQELTRRRLRVPDDIAIVGYDDIEFAAAAAVPLSSVRQPREELGRTAAALLLEEVRDPQHVHRQVLFDAELVVRESTLGAPVGHRTGDL
jgi:LacI family transcriptional regulator